MADETKAAALAPAIVKPDIETLLVAFTTYTARLDSVGFDYSRLGPNAADVLQTTAVNAAEQHLSHYLQDSCQIGDSPPAQQSSPASAGSTLAP